GILCLVRRSPVRKLQGLGFLTRHCWLCLASSFCVISLLIGCTRLRVSPRRTNLPLDQSISFTASLQDRKGAPLKTGPLIWEARDLDEHRQTRISREGAFTARLPGHYKI